MTSSQAGIAYLILQVFWLLVYSWVQQK